MNNSHIKRLAIEAACATFLVALNDADALDDPRVLPILDETCGKWGRVILANAHDEPSTGEYERWYLGEGNGYVSFEITKVKG